MKWEYLTLFGKDPDYDLNEFGAVGWELVCVVNVAGMAGRVIFYLKRQILY